MKDLERQWGPVLRQAGLPGMLERRLPPEVKRYYYQASDGLQSLFELLKRNPMTRTDHFTSEKLRQTIEKLRDFRRDLDTYYTWDY